MLRRMYHYSLASVRSPQGPWVGTPDLHNSVGGPQASDDGGVSARDKFYRWR